jgi:hypothetical protein
MDGPVDATAIADAEARWPSELPPTARQLVETAADEGSASYAGATGPPIDDGTVVRLDEAYYRVSIDKSDDGTTVTGYEYDVVTNDSVPETATSAETVDFDELPDHDRRSFLVAFGGKAVGLRDRLVEGARVSLLVAYASQQARRESVFVPESTYRYVRYGPTVFRLDPRGSSTVTVFSFRVDLRKVAESDDAFADDVRSADGRGVSPSALSTDARRFVEESISEAHGTETCYPLPDHVEAVLDAFGFDQERDHETQYVSYDGEWYRAWFGEFHGD